VRQNEFSRGSSESASNRNHRAPHTSTPSDRGTYSTMYSSSTTSLHHPPQQSSNQQNINDRRCASQHSSTSFDSFQSPPNMQNNHFSPNLASLSFDPPPLNFSAREGSNGVYQFMHTSGTNRGSDVPSGSTASSTKKSTSNAEKS